MTESSFYRDTAHEFTLKIGVMIQQWPKNDPSDAVRASPHPTMLAAITGTKWAATNIYHLVERSFSTGQNAEGQV